MNNDLDKINALFVLLRDYRIATNDTSSDTYLKVSALANDLLDQANK